MVDRKNKLPLPIWFKRKEPVDDASNKIARKQNLISVALAIITLLLFILGIFQYCQFKRSNDIADKNFKASSAAVLSIDGTTVVYAHAYKLHPFYPERMVNFQFKILNGTPHEAVVNSIKYKISFDTTFIKDILRANGIPKNLDFRIIDRNQPINNIGPFPVTQEFLDTLSVQDSISLSKNKDFLFIEVHYTNSVTQDKFKLEFIGTLSGEYEIRKEWIDTYWVRGNIPE